MTREEAIQYAEDKFRKGVYRLDLGYLNRGLYQIVAREVDFMRVAIAALRKQEERSKGCSACEMTTRGLTYKQIEYGTLRGDFINDSSGMYIIRYGGGQHSIVCDDDGAEIDIKFCPMCGRRLEDT